MLTIPESNGTQIVACPKKVDQFPERGFLLLDSSELGGPSVTCETDVVGSKKPNLRYSYIDIRWLADEVGNDQLRTILSR